MAEVSGTLPRIITAYVKDMTVAPGPDMVSIMVRFENCTLVRIKESLAVLDNPDALMEDMQTHAELIRRYGKDMPVVTRALTYADLASTIDELRLSMISEAPF